MKKQLLLLCLCLPLWVCGQYSSAVQAVAPGGMAFFTKWQTGQLNNNNGIQSSFGGYDAVHALLVPEMGMAGLPPGANAFLIELTLEGQQTVQVEIELPPLGPQHSAIAIPLFPSAGSNVLPELAGMVALLLQSPGSKTLQHHFRMRVFLAEGRRFLAEGGFSTEASFRTDRFAAAPTPDKAAPQSPDPDAEAYVRTALARDYAHLRLHSLVCTQAWADAPDGTRACMVRYQVQDAGGRCYTGETRLVRKAKKNGDLGKVGGVIWPNVQGECG